LSEKTSPEQPWPVRKVARLIAEWIGRLGEVWVEGQVTQISARPGTATSFLTLRDPAADMSLTLTCASTTLRAMRPPLTDGSRVVVHGRPAYFVGRGTLSLRVDEIRTVGIGELLARIEQLRQVLADEGLFDPARKRRLPFLPGRIGLITGRASAAEHDVLTNARSRWPGVAFEIRNVAVQGVGAVAQIVEALSSLDRAPEVDVIILARGGGSVEDLLPFSDETLCRAVSACRTPVVSAIGHEPDTPLVDHVADVRCSTPTAAAKRLVPDVAEESVRVRHLRDRARRALHGWVDREHRLLAAQRSRPVLADPFAVIDRMAEEIHQGLRRARRATRQGLATEATRLEATRSRLTTLGPAATLARGYAVVQLVTADGVNGVARSVADLPPGSTVRLRLGDGAARAEIGEHEPMDGVEGRHP
jgi:exodeoxyribonuclease VII large subunit